jgi:hypothetical protein
MPDFQCQLIQLSDLAVDANGVKEPLCNSCVQSDCENPIRKMCVTILGKTTHWRLWVTNNQLKQVVSCQGYMKNEIAESEDV